MKALKYIGGLIVALVAILTCMNVAFAAAEGKATCTSWSYDARSIIKQIQIKVDGSVKINDTYKDDGQPHNKSGNWDLGPGTHHIVITDWSFGDLSDEYNGPDKRPEGHVIFETTVTCEAPTTTAAPTTTVVATTVTEAPTTTASVVQSSAVTTDAPVKNSEVATSVTIVATTGATPTTAVVQTTDTFTAITLPATGSNSTPLIAAGVAFLWIGSMAVLSTRRPRPA